MSDQSHNTTLQQAIANHRAGRFAEAEPLYRAVLHTMPSHPDANHNLGILLAHRGRADLGLRYLKAALEANPGHSQYWLSYAEVLILLGHQQGAMAILERGKQYGLSEAAVDRLRAKLNIAPQSTGLRADIAVLYAKAIQHHQNGELEEAVKLYRRVLTAKPDFAEAFVNLGSALKAQGAFEEALRSYRRALSLPSDRSDTYVNIGNLFTAQGKLSEAVASYRMALAIRPGFAEAYYNLGNALKAQGVLEESVASYRKAIALKPDFAEAHYNLGNALKAVGRFDEASSSYCRAISTRPDFAEAHSNLGTVLFEQGKSRDAIACYREALAKRPDYAEAHNNLGNALKAQGALAQATASYRRAVASRPDYAEAHNNLGTSLYEEGKLEEALVSYRQALSIRPDYAEAHNNLGNLLAREGKLTEAIGLYRQAITIQPDYVEAYNHLGAALCESNRIAEGFEWFTRGSAQTYGTSNIIKNSGTPDKPHKAQHDLEQRAYLFGHGSCDNSALTDQFRIQHGDRLAGQAINLSNPVAKVEDIWRRNQPQIVVIDNLLTDNALKELQRFCWSSTIWREVFDDGYLGARPESGFACPLLAQIAEELRVTYSTIFCNHPLLYSWSFKYDNQLKGTKIHADFAAINVNFWITPDEANLDPDCGGLIVWDVAAPLDWDFAKYNTDETTIRGLIARENAKPVTIPYRANRAVIFDSDLFHETDRMAFKNGYCNRRINITLLYGRRGKLARPAGI